MVEKTVNTLSTIGKVAVVGAYVAAIGYDIYQNWNSTASTTGEKPESEESKGNGQEEEKKEPVQYQLDPSQDIESLTCPITMEVVQEPATTIYGHLFELSAIREWVRQKGVCPLTQKPLTQEQIYPQYGLKDTIEEMRRIKQENQESQRRIQELEAMVAAQNSGSKDNGAQQDS